MIVELVGAPGAGKSYLAPQIAAQFGIPIIKVGRLGQRHFYFALFAMQNWQLTRVLSAEFRRQEREHPELKSVAKFRRFRSMGAKFAKAQILGGGLIDEGPYQSILKIFEDSATREAMENYLALIRTPPDRTFLVEAADGRRVERMHARGDVPRLYLGEDNWRHWHASFVVNLALLKSILVESQAAKVLTNDEGVAP